MRDKEGRSPLAVAIDNKRTEVAVYLLELGCRLDDRKKSGLLLQACGEGELKVGRLETVKRLVEVYKCPKGGHQRYTITYQSFSALLIILTFVIPSKLIYPPYSYNGAVNPHMCYIMLRSCSIL